MTVRERLQIIEPGAYFNLRVRASFWGACNMEGTDAIPPRCGGWMAHPHKFERGLP
jgi:hypothetical protein